MAPRTRKRSGSGRASAVGFAVLSGAQFYRGAVLGRLARMLLALLVYYAFSMFVGMLIVMGVMIHAQLTKG